MKKALLLVSVLIISVMTTACINNLAVQELNNKAAAFMEEGDYQNAIERLKSSLDLDSTIFETHYNLAVAYTKAEEYADAIKVFNDAIKINPDFADTYYSLAVCEENLAADIGNSIVSVDDEGNIQKITPAEEEEPSSEDKLSDNNFNYMIELLKSAEKHYNIYLDKTSNQSDTSEVDERIKEINKRIEELTTQRSE